jgi:hypothetical protein
MSVGSKSPIPVEHVGRLEFGDFDPTDMLDILLPQPKKSGSAGLTKEQMRNLLENVNEEKDVFDDEQLLNIEDVLEQLGIAENAKYSRNDVKHVYEKLQLHDLRSNDIETPESFHFDDFEPDDLLEMILPHEKQPGIQKNQLKVILKNLHDEEDSDFLSEFSDVDDILEKLGIENEETYDRKDVERAIKVLKSEKKREPGFCDWLFSCCAKPKEKKVKNLEANNFLDQLLPESNEIGVNKAQFKVLLQSAKHDADVDDVLQNLGISDKEIYYRDDLKNVLKALDSEFDPKKFLERIVAEQGKGMTKSNLKALLATIGGKDSEALEKTLKELELDQNEFFSKDDTDRIIEKLRLNINLLSKQNAQKIANIMTDSFSATFSDISPIEVIDAPQIPDEVNMEPGDDD